MSLSEKETLNSLTLPSKLNLGCGNRVTGGYLNVDKYNSKADVSCDILEPLPFPSDHFEEVVFNHVIEHLPYRAHTKVLEEIHRVTKEGGILKLGYPEWEECVKNFLENKNGERWRWWVQTLYGSQEHPGQFHVAPILRERITEQLIEVGFRILSYDCDNAEATIIAEKTKPQNWF